MPSYAQQDKTLVELNEQLGELLRAYMEGPHDPEDADDPPAGNEPEIAIRFDLPVGNELPERPTIYVFLYKVHENLEVRSSLLPQLNGLFSPRLVKVRFAYLLSYWAPEDGGHNAGMPDSDMMRINNMLLNALINNRVLPGWPNSITEVIPPEEGLNSLGNFWQSLGDKPRLVYGYAVTLPVRLTDLGRNLPPVRDARLALAGKPPGDVPALAAEALRAHLQAQLQAAAELDEAERAQLSRLLFECTLVWPQPEPEFGDDQSRGNVVEVQLSGRLDQALYDRVLAELGRWAPWQKVTEAGGEPLRVHAVDHHQLLAVPARETPGSIR